MDVLWPGSLLLLGLIPLLVAGYIWMLRRRRRFTVRYSSLALVRAALPRYSRLRRHLPFALFLLALTSLMLALGRPVAIAAVPTSQANIILALDVSRSMCSTDIQPNRLQAAEAAALDFVESQKATHADRHRRLCRFRRADHDPHHGSGDPGGCYREPHHRAQDGDRQRHFGGDRCDRRNRRDCCTQRARRRV